MFLGTAGYEAIQMIDGIYTSEELQKALGLSQSRFSRVKSKAKRK